VIFLYTGPVIRVPIGAAAIALALFCGAASAQLRAIPQDAKRGEMRHVQETSVQIDGKAMRLAAGAQIRDASNRIVLPAMLPPGSRVKYLLDPQGDVSRVWVLTDAEAAQPDPKK
jgi:hypothetical protein